MNYVFSDGEGAVDNNSGVDYATSVSGNMTAARWVQEAPERTVRAPSFKPCHPCSEGGAGLPAAPRRVVLG